ncbi:Gfo/Idh/MocA family protein [Aeoliella sp.]|uniref:Gfo/Idh/MocA family protein n=1 Tax=Aeoliella sp. TaxID=2795800 RepID=UPI003CCC3161
MDNTSSDPRALRSDPPGEVAAPSLPYQPQKPRNYEPKIGLIGCGGISSSHLQAYRNMGYDVVALCDTRREAAEERRQEYYPQADVYTDYRELLDRADVDVVDIATHLAQRTPLVRAALLAGKHVLSQKPFVSDLDVAEELIDLAEQQGLKLAVNQNGRWAPYFSYLRQACKAGILGDVCSIDIHVVWDHGWIKDTPFDAMHHVILYDFAIHWFDIVACLFGPASPSSVFAQVDRANNQEVAPPLNAQVVVQYDSGHASLVFRGSTKWDPFETIIVTGTEATFRSTGPVCANDNVTITNSDGQARAQLEGDWFPDGFAGTMGELLCAIEEGREPENSAKANLRSLQLCFAAVESAEKGVPICPDRVRRVDFEPGSD